MEKGENYSWICMESILNKYSEGCNPDPFLEITTGKLLTKWNCLAEERPRNVIPNPTCLPTKPCSRKGRQGPHLEQEKPFSLQLVFTPKPRFLQAGLPFSSRKQRELERCGIHAVWLKTTTLRERFCHLLIHDVASVSFLLPKTFQEKPVMDE